MIPALSGRVCRIVARIFISRSHRSKCVYKMCWHTKRTSRSAEAFLRKEKVMATIKVKDGTPQGAETLCVTCRWARIVKGFSLSQQEIHCGWLWRDRLVRFPVSQCSTYDDKRLPSKCDMEKIAWILLTKKTGRTIGFVTAKQFREMEGGDAEIIPAAAIDATDTEE